MQAIEFETTVQNHQIRIPDTVPEGAAIRVLVLMNDNLVMQTETTDLKTLLSSVTEGLDEKDMERINDFGREQPEWNT